MLTKNFDVQIILKHRFFLKIIDCTDESTNIAHSYNMRDKVGKIRPNERVPASYHDIAKI